VSVPPGRQGDQVGDAGCVGDGAAARQGGNSNVARRGVARRLHVDRAAIEGDGASAAADGDIARTLTVPLLETFKAPTGSWHQPCASTADRC